MFAENGFSYCFHPLSSNVNSDKIITVYYMINKFSKMTLVCLLFGVEIDGFISLQSQFVC